jgi:hypothetical protein
VGNKFTFLPISEVKEGPACRPVKCQQIVRDFNYREYLMGGGRFDERDTSLRGAGAGEGGEKVVVAKDERPNGPSLRHSAGEK